MRPHEPSALSDAEWASYLFFRTNPEGLHRERWLHRHGCRRWFNLLRHTRTHQIVANYKMGEELSAAYEQAAQ